MEHRRLTNCAKLTLLLPLLGCAVQAAAGVSGNISEQETEKHSAMAKREEVRKNCCLVNKLLIIHQVPIDLLTLNPRVLHAYPLLLLNRSY